MPSINEDNAISLHINNLIPLTTVSQHLLNLPLKTARLPLDVQRKLSKIVNSQVLPRKRHITLSYVSLKTDLKAELNSTMLVHLK